eukprot:TRINITY_DN50730_c0_g1_i1.p1 TRINITY_DN50730_c0_g1~~TRINITY_DN50730_c0_g1_i1.p1  ORF type:complete len:602 (-),score=68.04 TRINITY_DN50730_c0_g1_i1:224-1951(-)
MAAAISAQQPHLLFILQDDMGWWDTAIQGNQDPLVFSSTENITQLAREGIILNNHYVHWHCSPTRRTFLTGRLPLHHGEDLSGETTDNIDLRYTWISEKLQSVGYRSYWFGKGHTGYKSWSHLPVNRGFDGGSALFLAGGGSYTTLPRWSGTAPFDNQEYSTDFFGSSALQAVQAHDPSVPMFLYLPWQATHTPYDIPPSCSTETCPRKIPAMLADSDRWTGAIVDALKTKGMYDNTLIVYSADNGGTSSGNNHPLRGEKHTNWQGAFRVTAFVSGGYVPADLRGTANNHMVHVADWYPTFCKLAGVDGSDDPPVMPLDPTSQGTCSNEVTNTIMQCGSGYSFLNTNGPAKCCQACSEDDACTHWVFAPSHTSKPPCHLKKGDSSCSGTEIGSSSGVKGVIDIYQGNKSYPPVDGQDIWSQILGRNETEPHPSLWLSSEVLIKDAQWKLLVAQPSPALMEAKVIHNGWKDENSVWHTPHDTDWPCTKFKDRANFQPCLFDLQADPEERQDLAAKRPDLVTELWAELNRTALTVYRSRSPAVLVGHCDQSCAETKWKGKPGPICGVPGCDGELLIV